MVENDSFGEYSLWAIPMKNGGGVAAHALLRVQSCGQSQMQYFKMNKSEKLNSFVWVRYMRKHVKQAHSPRKYLLFL